MIYIEHPYVRGKDGRCMYPVPRADHFVSCGKMITLHNHQAVVINGEARLRALEVLSQ